MMASLILSIFLPNYVKNCESGGFLKTTILTVTEKLFLIYNMQNENIIVGRLFFIFYGSVRLN